MVDVFSFVATMKISWLRRLRVDNSFSRFIYDLCPEIEKLKHFGGEYANIVMTRVHNPFWHDVAKHYKQLCNKAKVTDDNDFLEEYLHYNRNIIRDRKVVFIKEWVGENILQIKDLVNDDGSTLSYNEFRRKFTNVTQVNFILYEGILNVVRKYLRRVGCSLHSNNAGTENQAWKIILKGNQWVKAALNESSSPPTALEKWNFVFGISDWDVVFNKCHRTTVDVQLKWFQLRLLHRILPTRRYLAMCNLIDSPLCTYCSVEVESIQHLFWNCQIVQKFWSDLLQYLRDKCTHCDRLNLTEKLIVFGVSDEVITDKGLDFIILFAKFFIYKSRFQGSQLNFQIFLSQLRSRMKIEISISKIKSSQCAWVPYKPIL